MPDKNYINGIIIKSSKYGLNCSIKTGEFIEQLKSITNKNGWANFEIKKRREPSVSGVTHYAQENTYKPNDKDKPFEKAPDTGSDLPF